MKKDLVIESYTIDTVNVFFDNNPISITRFVNYVNKNYFLEQNLVQWLPKYAPLHFSVREIYFWVHKTFDLFSVALKLF